MSYKPSEHMMYWGAGGGFVLGGSFMIILLTLTESGTFLFGSPPIFFMALGGAYLGAMFGVLLGYISGSVIKNWLRNIPTPFTRADQHDKARVILPIVFFVSLLVGASIYYVFLYLLAEMFLVLPFAYFIARASWMLFVPPLISALMMLYASHRYLFRLRVISERENGIQKRVEKLKRHDLQAEPDHTLEMHIASQQEQHHDQA